MTPVTNIIDTEEITEELSKTGSFFVYKFMEIAWNQEYVMVM